MIAPPPRRATWEGFLTAENAHAAHRLPRAGLGARLAPVLAGLCAAALALAGCGTAAGGAPPPSAAGSAPAASSSSRSTAPSGSRAVTPASSTSTATVPTSWSGLHGAEQLWVQRNDAGIAADPAAPDDLVACGAGAVQLSRDGGKTWTTVPTAGVPAALARAGYTVVGAASPVPPCTQAVADPSHAGTVYAAWQVGRTGEGAPPVYYAAAFTRDGGRAWEAVTPPTGFQAGGFGGFLVSRQGAVRVMYGPVAAQTAASPPFALTETTDGGATWAPASLSCPPSGPCVRWGPEPTGTGSCAMNAWPQPVERSADGGSTWQEAAVVSRPDVINGCELAELVGLGPETVALVTRGASDGLPSLRVSADGGRTWTAVALPALPGGAAPAPRGVQLLPDGALLAVVGGGSSGEALDLLQAGSSSWCTVPGLSVGGQATDPGSVQPVGSRLFWIEEATAGRPVVKSAPLSALHC